MDGNAPDRFFCSDPAICPNFFYELQLRVALSAWSSCLLMIQPYQFSVHLVLRFVSSAASLVACLVEFHLWDAQGVSRRCTSCFCFLEYVLVFAESKRDIVFCLMHLSVSLCSFCGVGFYLQSTSCWTLASRLRLIKGCTFHTFIECTVLVFYCCGSTQFIFRVLQHAGPRLLKWSCKQKNLHSSGCCRRSQTLPLGCAFSHNSGAA